MKLLRILVIFPFAVALCESIAGNTNVGANEDRPCRMSPCAPMLASASSDNGDAADDDLHPHRATHLADSASILPAVTGPAAVPRDIAGGVITLSTAERAWIAQLPVMRIGIDPTAAPLTLVGRDGETLGLAMDYLDDALSLLGIRSVSVGTADWRETVKRAAVGEIDLLAAASPRNDALGKYFDFTDPYVEFPVMIVTREDSATIAGPEDLEGLHVAANMAQGAVATAVHRLPKVDVTDVRSAAAGLEAVATGRADAYVGDIATAEYLIRRDYPARLKLAAPTDERAELTIAVERRHAALLPLLNRALAAVSERRAQTIRNTWLRSEYTWGGSWREIARKVGPAGVAVLILLLVVTHAYVRLRREIRHRRAQATQLADAKQVAETATAAKTQFLSTMSHEIRTPMHGLIGMLEILRETPLDGNQRHLLGTAETSAEALLHILDDVLDFSRIEAGRIDIEHTSFNLRDLIEGVIELFARQTRQKGLAVTVRFDERLAPCIVCDAGRIRQVVLNLISNAIKFTAQGGIGVTVHVVENVARRQRLHIDIVDTGIGIEPEDIDRLFAPFSQAEASTTRRFGGSGLGLAISRRLVELLGGDLTIESEAGVGTRVTIVLEVTTEPVGDALGATAEITTQFRPNPSLSVLVAEDNDTNRELIAAQLDRLGYGHRIAADGTEALAIVLSQPVDVLLTDLHMPVMDGYALTTALRERGMTLRIVAMTANAMPGEKERCMAIGMDDFATKPLRLAQLAALLSPPEAGEVIPAPWDLDAWRDTYGDLALLPAMVDRFDIAVRDDLAQASALKTSADAAAWIHRILGSMRIFGPSPEAALAEQWEHALRGKKGAAEMAHLPEMVNAIEGYIERLRDALDAHLRD